jgi:copper transport protein
LKAAIPRLAVALAWGALGLVLAGPSASAHAVLESSDPSAGARLDAAPGSVSLTFSEQPEISLTDIDVLDASGASVVAGAPSAAPDDPFTARVALASPEEGAYTVTWRTVSQADGHATAGAFTFGVGVAARDVGVAERVASAPTTSWVEVVGRFGVLVGLVVLLGGASTAVNVFGGTPGVVRAYGSAGWLAAALGLLLLARAQWSAAGAGLGDVLSTSIGRALVLRALGLGLAGAGLAIAWKAMGSGRRLGYILTLTGAGAAMLAHVSAGHAAAGTSLGSIEVVAQWVHFVAVAVWLGGLAALLLGTRGATPAERTSAVRRFSTLAGVMLLLVAATGGVRALDELDGWGDLVTTVYGRIVLLKIVLLVALGGLGAVNRYRNVPKSGESPGGLRRVSRVEIGVAVLTLGAAALLGSVSPPSSEAAARVPERLVATGSDFATTVRARLEVTPGYAGVNEFFLRASDYDTGEPVDARRVSLRFSFLDDPGVAPATLRLREASPGVYRVEGGPLSLDGRWEVGVLIETDSDSIDIPLQLATKCRAERVTAPGRATVFLIELPGGRSVQGYVDPRAPGYNEVHITFFDENGALLEALRPPSVDVESGGDRKTPKVRPLEGGHYAAGVRLAAGTWRFDIEAALPGSPPARGCFEETIG